MAFAGTPSPSGLPGSVRDLPAFGPYALLWAAGWLALFRDLTPRRLTPRDPLGHQRPDPVVTARRVADADDQRGHLPSTVRSRKCVAQEMHGS